MFTLMVDSVWPGIWQRLFLPLLVVIGLSTHEAKSAPADWFPDSPSIRHYAWEYAPCTGCEVLAPSPVWTRMAALAGLPAVRFLSAPDERNGQAYSAAPDVVVLSPSALKLEACQLAFIVGHEIVHIAQRHFDEDAVALLVFSGKPVNWTDKGEDAMQLVEGDFGLALRVSYLWQKQEREADWLGALLAAQACGCGIESGALAYFRRGDEGGGIAAAHAPNAERIRQLQPFAESVRRLVELGTH